MVLPKRKSETERKEVTKMDEIIETQLIEKEQEAAAETEEKQCGSCEAVMQVKAELERLSAENGKLREELEQMKKLPRFSTKTVAEKNSLDAVRSIFRKK